MATQRSAKKAPQKSASKKSSGSNSKPTVESKNMKAQTKPTKKASTKTPTAQKNTPAAIKLAAAKKSTVGTKKSPPSAQAASAVSPAERMKMIAEAAYYMAAHRGFSHGHDVDDWVAAERQVDATLLQHLSATKRKVK